MDREKVIKGLECCKNKTMLWQHDQCPYHGFDEDCESNLHADALALLKEQEAVEPITQSSVYDPDTWFFVCGSCKKGVIERGDKFCRWCGQAVKWE